MKKCSGFTNTFALLRLSWTPWASCWAHGRESNPDRMGKGLPTSTMCPGHRALPFAAETAACCATRSDGATRRTWRSIRKRPCASMSAAHGTSNSSLCGTISTSSAPVRCSSTGAISASYNTLRRDLSLAISSECCFFRISSQVFSTFALLSGGTRLAWRKNRSRLQGLTFSLSSLSMSSAQAILSRMVSFLSSATECFALSFRVWIPVETEGGSSFISPSRYVPIHSSTHSNSPVLSLRRML